MAGGPLGIADQAVFGDLHLQTRGGQAACAECRAHRVDDIEIEKLDHRDVDAECHPRPGDGLAAGPEEHEISDFGDQRRILGDRHETVRRDGSAFRVLPADEGLDASDPFAVGRDDRLVGDGQMVLGDRPPQLAFDVEALLELLVHRPAEAGEAIAPGGLGLRHGEIGLTDEVARLAGGRKRHSDRTSEPRLDAAIEFERLGDDLEDRLRDRPGGGSSRAGQDHLELVAADPRHRIFGRDGAADSGGGGAERIVAGEVAKAVVQLLEAVEVDRDECERNAGLRERLVGDIEVRYEFPRGWEAP